MEAAYAAAAAISAHDEQQWFPKRDAHLHDDVAGQGINLPPVRNQYTRRSCEQGSPPRCNSILRRFPQEGSEGHDAATVQANICMYTGTSSSSPHEGSIRSGGAFRTAALADKQSSRQTTPRRPVFHEGFREASQGSALSLEALPEHLSDADAYRGDAEDCPVPNGPGHDCSDTTPCTANGHSGKEHSISQLCCWNTRNNPRRTTHASRQQEQADKSRRQGIGDGGATTCGAKSSRPGGRDEPSSVEDSVSSRTAFFNTPNPGALDANVLQSSVSGGDQLSFHEHRSSSLWMKNVSQRSTASHKIPKISGGYKAVEDDGSCNLTDEARTMPRYMIHPFDPRYRTFLMVTVFWAAATGFVTPWIVAFQSVPGLCPYKDFAAFFEYLAGAVFFLDICLSFNTAYYDQEILITERRQIAKHYLRFRFWFDLIAVLPFDYAIIEGIWPPCYTSQTARYVSLLKLLRLLRMYRVLLFFKILEYHLAVGLMLCTIVRNLVYLLFTCHWAGCAFYFIARQEGLTEGTWLGMYPDLLTAWPSKIDSYIFSLYWAVTTVATVGYGDFHATSIPEAVFTLIYMLFIIGLNAFIIGTLTLVVMKNDERTGQYRQRASNLKQYSNVNGIRPKLKHEMQEHLRLHFNNEEAADEQVLSIYPATIRRRILRFLYLQSLQKCYLFRDCRPKFLDAILSIAKIELFMPGSEIFAEGDHVNELTIVVGGLLEVLQPVHYVSTSKERDISIHGGGGSSRGGGGSKSYSSRLARFSMSLKGSRTNVSDASTSVALATRRVLGPGEVVGEVAFFTEVPQPHSVRSITVAKVLTISRQHYTDVSASYPVGGRMTLENLSAYAEQVVQQELATYGGKAALDMLPEALAFKWSSVESGPSVSKHRRPTLDHDSMAATQTALLQSGLTAAQEQVVANLLRIRTLVQQHVAKDDEEKTTSFLYAAAKGDDSKVRQMLRQGFAVDSSDYDNRTALMLAAAKGHDAVLAALLAAGADPQLADNLGGTALQEACKAGHDSAVAILKASGAKLSMGRLDTAGLLCKLVFDGDLPLLQRMVRAGIDANAADYDDRTALHVAACEGHLTAVKMLVEEGDADVALQDRWGNTALDEANRLGARSVARYLQAVMADVAEAKPAELSQQATGDA